MINYDDAIKEKIKEHNLNWPEIPGHPYIILIIRCSGSGKTNALLKLINHKPDIGKKIFYMVKIHICRKISINN